MFLLLLAVIGISHLIASNRILFDVADSVTCVSETVDMFSSLILLPEKRLIYR